MNTRDLNLPYRSCREAPDLKNPPQPISLDSCILMGISHKIMQGFDSGTGMSKNRPHLAGRPTQTVLSVNAATLESAYFWYETTKLKILA